MSTKRRVTGKENILEEDSVLQLRNGNKWMNVAHWEHLVYLAGPAGTMKSTILRYLAAAGSGKVNPLGLRLNLNGRRIAWFDGEQPLDILSKSIAQIGTLAGVEHEDYLDVFTVNGVQKQSERRNELWDFLYGQTNPRNIGLVIIDCADNFIADLNDTRESMAFVNDLKLTAKRLRCLILILSHTTSRKGEDSKLYGMFGTKLKNYASAGFDMERIGRHFIMRQTKTRYAPVSPKFFSYGKENNVLEECCIYPF